MAYIIVRTHKNVPDKEPYSTVLRYVNGRAVTFSDRKPAEIEAGRQSEPNNGIIRASVEFIPCPEL